MSHSVRDTSLSDITSKILGETLPWTSPLHKYWGDSPPCPISIDAPAVNSCQCVTEIVKFGSVNIRDGIGRAGPIVYNRSSTCIRGSSKGMSPLPKKKNEIFCECNWKSGMKI